MNYSKTLEYIHSLKKFSVAPSLKRISAVMDKLGNPQNELSFVHVAGTNGKGSVCTMLASAFSEAGYKTGLYTSPFIIDFRERIKVNGEFIPETELVELSSLVIETGIDVNEFEFITAVAFLYFAKLKCDVVVLETGLGGAFDATNVISSPRCSVITRIDLDHTAILGDTAEEICREKMGIAKVGCPVVAMHNQPDGIADLIKDIRPDTVFTDGDALTVYSSDITGSTFKYKGREYEIRLAGEFQLANAITALEALEVCNVDYASAYKGLKKAFIPARAEILSQSPLTVLDGAHNPNGALALAELIRKCEGRKIAVVGMMSDKNCGSVLKTLIPLFDVVYTVAVSENPRTLSALQTAKLASEYCDEVYPCENYEQVLSTIKIADAPVFIFGSLYLASDIRKFYYND